MYEPYITPFWRQLGFSPAQLGLLNSISPAIAACVPFLWTAYADVTRRGGAIFLLNTWISALPALLLPSLNGLLGNGLRGLLYEPLGKARLYAAAAALAVAATVLYCAGTRASGAAGHLSPGHIPKGQGR